MKNMRKVNILLVIVLMIGMTTIGCGEHNNSENHLNVVISKTDNNDSSSKDIKTNASAELKELAKAEGISEKELSDIEAGLIKIGAEKYGLSEKHYLAQIESTGNTVLGEWKVAADYMGLSIKEIYSYEKDALGNMTDEQKNNLSSLASAVSEAQDAVDSEEVNAVSHLTGIYMNDTGVVRVLTMTDEELRTQFEFAVHTLHQDNFDEYSQNFFYTSDGDFDDLETHFDELVLNTQDYTRMSPPGGQLSMINGVINGSMVYITIDQTQGGMATVEIFIDLTTTY